MLSIVLLALQILLGGLAAGDAAAHALGGGSQVICTGGQPSGSPARTGDHHECPCILGPCCAAVAADVPACAAAPTPVLRETRSSRGPTSVAENVDRRPLSLFARAGRSPPSLS